jgi:hypothetical protein
MTKPHPASCHGPQMCPSTRASRNVARCAIPAAPERDIETVADELRQMCQPARSRASRWLRKAGESSLEARTRTAGPCRSPFWYRLKSRGKLKEKAMDAIHASPKVSSRSAAALNSGSTTSASSSASNTFLANPIVKMSKPSLHRRHSLSHLRSSANGGMSSLCRTIGPAIKCGKTKTHKTNGRNG